MQSPTFYNSDLLQDIVQLDTSSIEQLKSELEAILEKRNQSILEKKEKVLVEKIYGFTNSDTFKRYQELTVKVRSENISEPELSELSEIQPKIDQFNTERLEHLIALSKIRKKSVRQVMEDLGLILSSSEN